MDGRLLRIHRSLALATVTVSAVAAQSGCSIDRPKIVPALKARSAIGVVVTDENEVRLGSLAVMQNPVGDTGAELREVISPGVSATQHVPCSMMAPLQWLMNILLVPEACPKSSQPAGSTWLLKPFSARTTLEQTTLACVNRGISSPDPAEVAKAVARAAELEPTLAIPCLLQKLQDSSTNSDRASLVHVLGSLRSRQLLPTLMSLGVGPREMATYADDLSLAVTGKVPRPRAGSAAQKVDWRAWWSRHSEDYWVQDFRDWSQPSLGFSGASYVAAMNPLSCPFEAQLAYSVGGDSRFYFGGIGTLACFSVGSEKLIISRPLRSVLSFRSADEVAAHSIFAAVYVVGDELWCPFPRPWGMAVLDGNLGLKRYHPTDKEAIEAEYGPLLRHHRELPIWPIDEQGRIWEFVESARAIRVYDGARWQALDLRTAASGTPRLLQQLGCTPDQIAAYSREYVQAKWVTQTTDGAIYIRTTEGLLVRQNGHWRHLNALDTPWLGAAHLACEGKGQSGELWISCREPDQSYGLLRVCRGGDEIRVFAGWSGLPWGPGQAAGGTGGRTWFLRGFQDGSSGPAVRRNADWVFFPPLPWGDPSPRGWCFAPEGKAWFYNDVLVGYVEGEMCHTLTAPDNPIVGLLVDQSDQVCIVTRKSLWRRIPELGPGTERWQWKRCASW